MRISLVCAAVLAVAPFTVNAQDAGRSLAATCAMCHGTSGHSVGGNETLAGMPKDEMVRKFKEFQSGAKPATVMHQISKGFTDPQLDQIAAYFAAQKR
ncbi:MAG: cytochrome C [Burkholderiales bacterium]